MKPRSRVSLRVLQPTAPHSSAMGLAASVPWCCILPAGLAALGLAASVVGQALRSTLPAAIVVSLVFFARAHYLLWFRRHGTPLARITTVVLTALAAAFWAFRLSPTVAELLLG